MRSVLVREPLPSEFEAFIQRRQALGQDRHDEVWEGVYHITPGPNTAHAFVEHELAAVLRPNAMEAGLVGSGQFNLGEWTLMPRKPWPSTNRLTTSATLP